MLQDAGFSLFKRSCAPRLASLAILALGAVVVSSAAPPNRITRPVDAARTRIVSGNLHRRAEPQYDRGAVDPGMRMDYMVLAFKPSSAQQAELDGLLADQQNPSSQLYHQWLTPEAFGDRFGLSASDHSKAVAWLTSQGFSINESGRGRNWVAFSGTAAQVSRSLHTAIHRFEVDGKSHFANTSEPSVPDALGEVAGGFLGLNDFQPRSFAQTVSPEFNSGASHFMVPEDFATIYNVAPLYKAGFDGTGQSIAIVGQSAVLLSDLAAFKTRYNLPANVPKLVPYTGADPGFNGAQVEGNLDLEWSSAIAPNATIYYVYGPSAITATVAAISLNVAPVISISYGNCEIDYAPSFYRSILQQGNAQGITILAASGDSGAGGCDPQGSAAFAAHGRMVDFPAVVPEVTGVGGTQFVEGSGNYWATANTANFGSALSYIPEAAWNESGTGGLLSGGGGASVFYPKPSWQNGPGVPDDNVRHVPDIALSAAVHDAYFITVQGTIGGVAGTSASAPSMAGIVALLNQYQVAKGFQKLPGLGNINPQLYRLAQSAPSVFHDTIAGDNIVSCAQGSPDCLTGSFGYPTVAGYDMATGLGSVDANSLVTQWNTRTQPVSVVLSLSATRVSPNDTVALTAGVFPANGGAPTGSISFSSGTLPLGTSPLTVRNGQQVADLFFPAYLLEGTGTFTLTASYGGDAAFSSGGATRTITVAAAAGTAAIIPTWPNTVWPSTPDAQGLIWQTTFTLREAAGVPAIVTGFTIDGQAQPLARYFPSPNIPAGGTLTVPIVFRNLAAPTSRTFGISGVDATGQTWSREFSINFNPLPPINDFTLTATPLVITQNTAADPACQWSTQLNADDIGGSLTLVTNLTLGDLNATSQVSSIFGTERLDAWGSLQGVVCFGGITPPASEFIFMGLSSGAFNQVTVSFAGPPPSPSKISATPANISLAAAGASQPAAATLAVGISDKTQPWTASIFPANRTTAWLTASQYSGTGPGQISLTANGTGFEPGVYRATIVIQSANAVPQYLNVPVIFVLGGGSAGPVITGVANPASYQTTGSPGMALSIFGSKLANATQTVAAGSPIAYTLGGVSATVNGSPAPVLYASAGQLNIQVPYSVGAGPAVVGINNNGQIAGFTFQVAPSAPGIFVDSNGSLPSNTTIKQGAVATLFMTGAGEVSPALKTAYAPTTAATAAAYRPVLPLSLTVGGVPVFVQAAHLAVNQFGVTQVDFIVPASVPLGVQPVVVTVNGVASPPARLTVQAP